MSSEHEINGWRIYRDPDHFDMYRVSLKSDNTIVRSAYFNTLEQAAEFAENNRKGCFDT